MRPSRHGAISTVAAMLHIVAVHTRRSSDLGVVAALVVDVFDVEGVYVTGEEPDLKTLSAMGPATRDTLAGPGRPGQGPGRKRLPKNCEADVDEQISAAS